MLTWRLRAPDGTIHRIENLNKWTQENAALFGKKPEEWEIINAGLRALRRSKSGKLHRQAKSYYGWTLLSCKWREDVKKRRSSSAPTGYVSKADAMRILGIGTKKMQGYIDRGEVEGLIYKKPFYLIPCEWVEDMRGE